MKKKDGTFSQCTVHVVHPCKINLSLILLNYLFIIYSIFVFLMNFPGPLTHHFCLKSSHITSLIKDIIILCSSI